jgi:hypothetical protein
MIVVCYDDTRDLELEPTFNHTNTSTNSDQIWKQIMNYDN